MRFPIMQLSKIQGTVHIESKADRFGLCTLKTLKQGYFDDMLVVDSDGGHFTIRGVKKISPMNKFWHWPIEYLLYSSRLFRAEFAVSAGESVSSEELKNTVVSLIRHRPNLWGSSAEVDALCEKVKLAAGPADVVKLISEVAGR